jgi:hypothetical protein
LDGELNQGILSCPHQPCSRHVGPCMWPETFSPLSRQGRTLLGEHLGMAMCSAFVADSDICYCSLDASIVELSVQKMIQPLCDLVVRGLLADTVWFQLPAPLVLQWHSKILFGFGERQVPTSQVLLRYRVQCISDHGRFLALEVIQNPQSLMVHFQ